MRAQAFKLPAQDRTGGYCYRLVPGFQLRVADHEGSPIEPGQPAECAKIGRQMHVAVSEFPTGELVAGDWFHLHVHGKEVVAGVGAARHVGEEERGVEALAHQFSVGVGEPEDDGVYRAVIDGCAQFIDAQHPWDGLVIRAHFLCLRRGWLPRGTRRIFK